MRSGNAATPLPDFAALHPGYEESHHTAQASTGCSSPAQQARHRDVFVDIGPMNAVTAADEAPVLALIGRRVDEPWKPGQRRGQFAAVPQHDKEAMVIHQHINGSGVESNGGSGHS